MGLSGLMLFQRRSDQSVNLIEALFSMASINKVILVGNLGADPEMRTLPNGDAVANIRLATTESWKDKATGEKKELTE